MHFLWNVLMPPAPLRPPRLSLLSAPQIWTWPLRGQCPSEQWAWQILFHALTYIHDALLVLLLYWLWTILGVTCTFMIHIIPTHLFVFISYCPPICQQHWNFHFPCLDLYTCLSHSLGAGVVDSSSLWSQSPAWNTAHSGYSVHVCCSLRKMLVDGTILFAIL